MIHMTCAFLAETSFYLGQCGNKTLDILPAVARGHDRKHISNIAKLHLDIVGVPENVIYFNSRKTYIPCVYGQLCLVKGEDIIAVHKLIGISVISAYLVYLRAGVFCGLYYLSAKLFALSSIVFSCNIKGGQQQI